MSGRDMLWVVACSVFVSFGAGYVTGGHNAGLGHAAVRPLERGECGDPFEEQQCLPGGAYRCVAGRWELDPTNRCGGGR